MFDLSQIIALKKRAGIYLSPVITPKKRIGIYLTSSETGAAYMSMSDSDQAETFRLRLDEDGSSVIPTLIEYRGDKVVIGRKAVSSKAFYGIVPVGRISDDIGSGRKYSQVILDFLAEVLKTCSKLNGLSKDDKTLGAFFVLPVCPEDAASLEKNLCNLMGNNSFSWSIGVMAECTAIAILETTANNSVIYDFSLHGTRFHYLRRGVKYCSSYSGFDGDMLASALVCRNLGKSYEEFRRMSGSGITQLSSAAFGMIKRYSRQWDSEKRGIYLKNHDGSFGDEVYTLKIDEQELIAAADVPVSATISNKLENSKSWKDAAISFVKTTVDQIVNNDTVDSVIVTGDLARVVSKLNIFGNHSAADKQFIAKNEGTNIINVVNRSATKALGRVSDEKLKFIGKPTPEDAIKAFVEFYKIKSSIFNDAEVKEITDAANEVRAEASTAAAQNIVLDYQNAAVHAAADHFNIIKDDDKVKSKVFSAVLMTEFEELKNPKNWADAYNNAFSENIKTFINAVEKYFSDSVNSTFTWDRTNRGEFIKTALAESFVPVNENKAVDWPIGDTNKDMLSYCLSKFGTASHIGGYFTKPQLDDLRTADCNQIWENNNTVAKLSQMIADRYNGDENFNRFAETILNKMIKLYTMREF